jgi:DNA helicase-2/ATP-dependent DNA helicase PcrA
MSVSDAEREQEERHLQAVLEEIGSQLTRRKSDVAKYRSVLTGTQESLREEGPQTVMGFEDLVEVAGGMNKLREAAKMHRFSKDRAAQLERLQGSPYFARVDFCETGKPDVQVIYIGISSLMQQESGRHLIYDWRAPVSSVYYDYELGPAEYEAPLGTVTGDILLKRHFRIKEARIELLFDNSLTIYDEMLQETLSKASGDRMRNIVNTIQREQNRVIRGESSGALVVQGSAGSGKTVIALHRAAYLLYKHRATMSSKSILMFSPGRMFVDYTSPVLPELGEEPVVQTSFGEFAAGRLTTSSPGLPSLQIEHQSDQLEFLLDGRGTRGLEVRSWTIRLKSSAEFADLLIRYAKRLAEGAECLGQVTFRRKVIMSSAESAKLLRSEYGYLPVEKRVEKIKRRVDWLLDEVEERRAEEIHRELTESPDSAYLFAKEIRRMSRMRAHEEVQALRDRVRAWRPVSVYAAYARLFEDEELFRSLGGDAVTEAVLGDTQPEGEPLLSRAAMTPARRLQEVREQTLASLRSGTATYEDLAPLLLMQGLMDGFLDPGDIRHVIVDEAQDYTPVQHEVLRRSFPGASFTLLGDVNQAMNPDACPASYEEMARDVARAYGATGPVVPVKLTESYRSTREITEFTKALLAGGEPVEAVERPGELPVLAQSGSREVLARAVAADVAGVRESGLESIAVICKTARESWAAFEDLKALKEFKSLKPRLVGPKESRFRRGVLVMPSYLAKGLEFEAVVIYDAGRTRYRASADRGVLYTACTRALHRLHIHYTGELSPFIAGIDPRLYERRK